jgi:hypothetical protein
VPSKNIGDKFCIDESVISPSICKRCLATVEKYGTKEKKERAFELLSEQLLRSHELY